MAYGQAAMLLSLGMKGKRGVLPNSISMSLFSDPLAYMHAYMNADTVVLTMRISELTAKLHLPKVHKSGGAAIDMWIKVKSSSCFQHMLTFD